MGTDDEVSGEGEGEVERGCVGVEEEGGRSEGEFCFLAIYQEVVCGLFLHRTICYYMHLNYLN